MALVGPIMRAMTDPAFHALPDGRRIAYRFVSGTGPALVFLPGYMSDMAGSKAQAVMAHARAKGQACLLLDYSGCGESDGDFADGSLARWRGEIVALVNVLGLEQVVLIGSSMGGWLMLLAALDLGERVKGLVGIAAAPDFTEWGFDEGQKAALAAGRTIFEDNAYGPEPTPTHGRFWADGQRNLLLGGEIALACPVRLLHGQADPDVPWEVSLRLAAALRSTDAQVTLIKDGDHRLSREGDIAVLLARIDEIAG